MFSGRNKISLLFVEKHRLSGAMFFGYIHIKAVYLCVSVLDI